MACSKAEGVGAVQCGHLTAPSRICRGCSSGAERQDKGNGHKSKEEKLS